MDCIENLKNFAVENKCTLLGIGPMSKNCVDVVIEIANEYDVPLMLIASRRQIESKELGSGYVNNWSTEEFAKYVKENDKKSNVILCRDHGGPYQDNGYSLSNLSLEDAMENAKKSFRKDIESGFKIIHIDPSANLTSTNHIDEMLNRIFELYDFCYSVSKETNNEIFVEVSIGKEDGGIHDPHEVEFAISKLKEFCKEKDFPLPLFFVVKTGNHVMETSNVGIFENIVQKNLTDFELKFKKIIDYCNKNKILIKVHNGDYLSDDSLQFHPSIGFHAINIAPEFGVTETKAILDLLQKNNLEKIANNFFQIAYNSNKWEKWMLNNSLKSKIDKAIIAGHYVFSDRNFLHLKDEIVQKLSDKDDFDSYLKSKIKLAILRYCYCLKIINN